MALASRAVLCATFHTTGAWNEALRLAEDLIERLASAGPSYFEYHLRVARSRIGLARGVDDELVLADARRAVEVGRSAKDLQALVPVLSNLAFTAAELGRMEEAWESANELASLLSEASPINTHRTVDAAWVAERLGCEDALRRLALAAPDAHVWREAVLAVLDRDFERAADAFAALGHVDEGYAWLRAGEQHLAEGRGEGEAQLRQAIAFFRPLGATRYVSRPSSSSPTPA